MTTERKNERKKGKGKDRTWESEKVRKQGESNRVTKNGRGKE
mgnify:CR=1 FL=1